MKVSVRLVLPAVAMTAGSSSAPAAPAAPAAPIAPAAAEQPSFTTVTATDSVDPGGNLPLDVRCPRGALAFGGGIWSGAPALGAVVQGNGPESDRSWETNVDNVAEEELDLTAYAMCLKGTSPSQWIRTPDKVVFSSVWHAPKTVTMSCPSGTRAIGGGVTNVPVSSDIGIVGLARVDGPDNDKQRDDAVRLTYFPFHRVQFELTALCARGERARGLSYVSKRKAVGPEDQVSVTARCPRGTRVVGGWFEGPDNIAQIMLSSMRPADAGDKDQKRDDAWQVVADNYSASVNVTAHATCWTVP